MQRIVAWHPHDSDVFALAQSDASIGKIDFLSMDGSKRPFEQRATKTVRPVSCMEWNPHVASLLAYGDSHGFVHLTAEPDGNQSHTQEQVSCSLGARR
jgi:hypothetical protein